MKSFTYEKAASPDAAVRDIDRAGVAGGVLTLTMTPDAAVWPRG